MCLYCHRPFVRAAIGAPNTTAPVTRIAEDGSVERYTIPVETWIHEDPPAVKVDPPPRRYRAQPELIVELLDANGAPTPWR